MTATNPRRLDAATRGPFFALAAVLLLLAVVTTSWSAGAASSPPAVRTGVMPAGPGGGARWEWEPQVAIDGRGGLWAVGGHCPFVDHYGPCGASTTGPGRADVLAVWRSNDNARTWHFVADPLAAPGAVGTQADVVGSSDPDIAVTPVARHGRPPIVAAISLWGVSTTLALSPDEGRSWAVVPGAGVPGQDRPWLAASGTCDLFVEYTPISDLAGEAAVPRVDRYDACSLADAAPALVAAVPVVSQTIEPVTNAVVDGNQLPGRLTAGRRGLFASYLTCASSNVCTLSVATSRDRGRTWTDARLPDAAVALAPDPTFPIAASADAEGRVAVAVTDRRHVYLWVSTDDGRSWSRRRTVDAKLGWTLANVPSVAVRGRKIVVAWFGSPPSAESQRWYLVVARSDDTGRSWQHAVARPVLATTGHGAPLGPGLYDDFGTAITTTGDGVAVYTQSCKGHTSTDPECPTPSPAAPGTYDVTRCAWMAHPR